MTPKLFSRPLCAAAALAAVASALSAPASAAPICLRSIDILDTRITDDQTIEFRMTGGKTYINKLASVCTGLKINNGFAADISPNGEYCDNQGTIRVLNSGNVCMLGAFTPAPEKPQ